MAVKPSTARVSDEGVRSVEAALNCSEEEVLATPNRGWVDVSGSPALVFLTLMSSGSL